MIEPIVCKECFPGAKDIGEIFEHYFLVKLADGRYVIMDGNGHSDCEIMVFNEKPEMEPHWRKDEWIDWANKVHETVDSWKFGIELGYQIMRGCNKFGHRRERDCFTAMWIYKRAAKMIKEWEERGEE